MGYFYVMKHPVGFTGMLLAAFLLLTLIAAKTEDTGILLYYWNFNSTATPTSFQDPNIALVDGSIGYIASESSQLTTGTGQSFATLNAKNSDPAGAHLRLNNPIGSSLIFNLSTIGYQDPVMKYVTRRSGSGAATQKISYTTNGIEFISFQTFNPPDGTPVLVTLDFSAISEVDNNPNFAVQIEFEEGIPGNIAGNNRFDNVTLEGSDYEGEQDRIMLVLPPDHATGVALLPQLKWHDADGILDYDVQISTEDDFESPTTFQVNDASQLTLASELDPGVTYYWRVSPQGENDWSQSRSFETIFSFPGTTEIASPANNAAEIELRPVFEWTEAENADWYELQVSSSDDFSSIVADMTDIADITKQLNVTLLENTTYFWRVRGQNAARDGEWSSIGSFTTLELFQAFDIRLNEISASNKNFKDDEDGDFEDWIEIYNMGDSPLSLDKFGLSDDALNPFKWKFPDVILLPGEYILVWASDKDRTDVDGPLHTNFKIAAEGESIILTSADGVTLDVFPSVSMDDDESYGRFPNGLGEWGLSAVPSPGETNEATDVPLAITSFKFETAFNPGSIRETIICDIYGDSLIVGIIPYSQDVHHLKATFAAGAAELITVAGQHQNSSRTVNDFSESIFYTITSGNDSKKYEVKLVYTGLPVVYVYTNGGAEIADKENYVGAQLKIYPNDASAIYDGTMGIRGRGNTTWGMPKKPYRIKLSTASSILGMPSEKDWVLLANYSDKTLIRNSLALYLGSQTRLPYSARMKSVDLVLNGSYLGTYLLGEHQEVSANKIDIEELEEDDEDESKVTGGYFLEIDTRLDGDFWFKTPRNIPIVLKSPEEPNEVQADYITGYIRDFEDVLFSENFADPVNGYAKYINIETFIDWYWINELYKNSDAIFFSSVFLYKTRDGKLNMGPLWDFDIGAGNIDYNNGDDPSGWWVRFAPWIDRLLDDPAFEQAVNDRWNELRQDLFSQIPDLIDGFSETLKLSQEENFHKWDILNTLVWPNPKIRGSYDAEVDHLKSWLIKRTNWIDAQVNKPELVSFALQVPNGNRIVASTGGDDIIFQWGESTPGALYKLMITTEDGTFEEPLTVLAATDFGFSTTASISMSDMSDILLASQKDSLTLKWSAFAYIDTDSLAASEPFTFTLIDGFLEGPILVSPLSGSIVENLNPTLSWHSVYPATSYQVQISAWQDFRDLLVNKTSITDTSYVVTEQLIDETTYYWRVMSVGASEEGQWSEVRSFTTPIINGVEDDLFGASIYPNPATNQLHIDVPSFMSVEVAELFDMIGKRAAAFDVQPGRTNRIDISTLSRGMYVMILRGKPNTVLTKKIMLR